ncbi:MAG: hypothetical protein WBK67_03155 [Minisyncoccales bacterium]|jgi:hypothetical protein
MIYDNLGLQMFGEEDCRLTGTITQDNLPVLEQNYVEKCNANNGFTKKRMFRKIASIPVVAVLQAAKDGYNFDNRKDLNRYLEDHPGFRTVDAVLTGRSPNIIVK